MQPSQDFNRIMKWYILLSLATLFALSLAETHRIRVVDLATLERLRNNNLLFGKRHVFHKRHEHPPESEHTGEHLDTSMHLDHNEQTNNEIPLQKRHVFFKRFGFS